MPAKRKKDVPVVLTPEGRQAVLASLKVSEFPAKTSHGPPSRSRCYWLDRWG